MSKELVSNFIFEEIEDSELVFGIITITWVKISSDLSYLDIFVSSFKNSDILAKTLAKHNKNIQSRLNKTLDIRKLPRIRFRYDDSGETSHKIYNKIMDTTKNI